MAPNVPPKPTPPRRSLTLKGLERKRPGPPPKPLSERLKNKPLKQVKRIERSYTRERKVEVLLYLLQHRVPDPRPRKVPRRRIGQPHEEELTQPMVTNEYGELVWYRAPTYSEASEFWKIPTPTIQGWWDAREKILEGTGFELPQVGPGGVSTALAEQVGPEGISRALAEASGESVGGATDETTQTQTQASSVTQEGQQRVEDPSAGGTPATNGAPPTPSSNPSSSPNAASGTLINTPAPAPVTAPSPVPRRPPGAQSTAVNGTPSTLAAIGTQPQQQQQQQPPRPINVSQRGPNGGIRTAGVRAPRLAPAPAPVPVGHAVPQGPPHVAGPPPPAYAGPHPPPHPAIPPAFNPAHYVVLYTGPHPGPWEFPGQQCLPPGIVLPIVYANQPVGVGPAGFVSVYPAPPAPVPTGPPPPPPPNLMHHHHNNHTGQHNIPYAHPPVPHVAPPPVHHHHHLPPQSPYPPQGPPQPPAFIGQPPMTPGGGAPPPSAQAPYPGPTGYVSPYAPPGVAGPRPTVAAHSPPPTPIANTRPGQLPKVAIPKLAPKRNRQQTQQSPRPPPSPQVQPTVSAQHEQPIVVNDGSIAAKAPEQAQNADASDEEQSPSDRQTSGDPDGEGNGDQASSQISPSPEGDSAVEAPAEDTPMVETETPHSFEASTENSTAASLAVPEVPTEETPEECETELTEPNPTSPSVAAEETLMMDIDAVEQDHSATATSSPSNNQEEEGQANNTEDHHHHQFETPSDTAPSMMETVMEDVDALMQVSMETPGAVLSELVMSPEEHANQGEEESSEATNPE
ncbi:hypothetical protein QBC44DRAFT_355680 [Cladorrhinum sp. PSN332]|nr:hypothetical protein QBC44DRAFT_355680 [Cladorrhinum sp. PSN332]